MFLKSAIRLKKGSTKFTRSGSPWVYSNELASFDKNLSPGSWVSLENHDGQTLGYGHFNPHSLISFRVFERAAFRSEEQVRALFFRRLDQALQLRIKAFQEAITAREMGARSFRLAFGESDGVPGLVIDLYESSPNGMAVVQCHSAGADQFVFWTQTWLEERLGISCGVLRNDLEVRRKEQVRLEVSDWGTLPNEAYALEGGVRFLIDPKAGQKTGYFYDLRDNRAELARRAARYEEGAVLDCFSYMGGWGLQVLKKNSKARLVALDVSKTALEAVLRNAEANGFSGRVETVAADFFKDKKALGSQKFEIVVCDPPALTSSAKQAAEGRRAHESCFYTALGYLERGGIAALSSCSFHLSWDEFLGCVQHAGIGRNAQLKISHVGSQSADHPILATLVETRYIKSVIVEELWP
ncbi:MAG: class I SAM-dependent rRNA methyltransferase [Bdellovibrionota bacterium]